MPTLLCFGDSNTHGTRPLSDFGHLERFDAATRWPGVCAAALGADWTVIAEGQPGRTTTRDDPTAGAHKNGLKVLPALLETHRPIDLVAVMLGTNDLKRVFQASALDIALSLERLVHRIRTSDAGPGGRAPAVLLIAPPPIIELGDLGEMFAGGAATARALPARLSAMADRCGVGFLDAGLHAAMDAAEGIHMPDTAHAALGAAVANRVRGMV
ncbi:MAG: GDSL-type esterase/lipase family protein [Pseudomonadota bacterium]